MNQGRPARYHRVPTGNTSSEDGNDDIQSSQNQHHHRLSSHSSYVGGGGVEFDGINRGGEDPLQQSLLLAPSDDDVATSQAQDPSRRYSLGGIWESPPRLHCVMKYALDFWYMVFPHIRRFGNLLFGTTILTMLIVVPMVTYTAIEEHRFDFAAFDSAGVMVLGTLVLSFRLVYLHLTHWYMPEVQKYVVRIVWMVPLYAVQSWLSLRFRDARIYIDAIRDLYEAFVIASFLYYLIELLGGQEALVRTLESKREAHPNLGKHSWPLNQLLHDWQLGTEFMLQCKHGVLQYVVVKTAATVLTYMFEITGSYGEGKFQWNTAYPYLAFVLNTSVMYALYALVMLFHAVREELIHPINWRPLGKFLCVKGVVFFTWWQGVIIFYLQNKGIIKDAGSWSGDEIANALIDYCICTEMVFFAVAHSYTFSYKEYLPSSIPPELRNLTVNANIMANANAHTPSPGRPLRLEPSQSSGSLGGAAGNPGSALKPTYRAPAVLDRPLDFKEAFWSSSIPKETIADIQRLRNGLDTYVRGEHPSGSISLAEIQSEADAVAVVANATATGNAAQAQAAAQVAAAASEVASRRDVPGLPDELPVDLEQAQGGQSQRRSSGSR